MRRFINRFNSEIMTSNCMRILIAIITGVMSVAGYAQTPATLPAAYTSPKINYVRTWDASAPLTNPNDLMTGTLQQSKQVTQYLDGLGRPLQTVIKKGSIITNPLSGESGDPVDMVQTNVYDEFGRERYSYLSSPANNTGSNTSISDGLFKLNPFQQQEAFFNTYLSAQAGEVSSSKNWAYAQTNFEASPLGRSLESFAPGVSWVGSNQESLEANRKSGKVKYWLNTDNDAVRVWNVTDGSLGSFGTYSSPGDYDAGELTKSVTIDENNKQVIEFKDKSGRLILKKVQFTSTSDGGSGTDHNNWLCTYYIYDDRDQLRAVIQPEGVDAIDPGWSLTSTVLDEQCFRYEYDARGRMIMRKAPGAGEVYMVYDARDRLVMTQDANMRGGSPKKWMVTKYDAINRPTETGLWQDNISFPSFTTHLSTAAATSTSYPTTSSGYETLTITHYDDYSGLPSGLSDYLTTWDGEFNATSNSWPYYVMPQKSTVASGLLTWTQIKVLGTSTFLNTVTYYDDKGRVIQTQSTNLSGGVDVLTTQYSWLGQPLITVMKQQKSGGTAQTIVAVTKLTYDDLGRLVKREKKVGHNLVNSGVLPAYKTLSEVEYDALGQVKKKKLAPAFNSNAGLETLNYDYNIRGWMLGANRDYAKDASSTNWFGFDLGYDKTNNGLIGSQSYSNSQYNGNITGMVWKGRGDGEKRKYDFNYDGANRIMKADFKQYNGSTFTQPTNLNFDMKMGDGSDPNSAYYANGNIRMMQHWGLKGVSSTQLDHLLYTYQAGSNKLKSVVDFTNDAQTKLGDFRTAQSHSQATTKAALTTGSSQSSFDAITDYSYDANGNMNVDNNKAISSITYNHLNQPSVITVTGKGTITYTYDAAGVKLQKQTIENGVSVAVGGTAYTTNITTTTNYIEGSVYESKSYSHSTVNTALSYTDKLQFLAHEEGRIRFKEPTCTPYSSLQYDYMLKDHLDNVRMVLTEETECQDEYPVASLETAQLTNEQTYYGGLTNGRVNKSTVSTYPSDPTTNPNDFIQGLSGGGAKTGSNIILKVMAGDKFNVSVSSWWSGGTPSNPPSSPLTDIVNALNAGIPGFSGGKVTSGQLSSSNTISPGANSFLTNQGGSYNTTRPKAFLNWILFDEQFNYVQAGSGFDQVEGAGFKPHVLNDVAIPRSGYLYVYVSNETPNITVYFDNLRVTHVRGPLLEETHYYPFGLTMHGLSSKAIGKMDNKNKYIGKDKQEKEWADESGLEWYDYGARMYDNQLGKFFVQDEFSTLYSEFSPYNYVANNPVNYKDPDGKLMRDQDNNLIITTTGIIKEWFQEEKVVNGDGSVTTTRIKVVQELVYLYADDNTKIEAYRPVSSTQITYTKGSKTMKDYADYAEGPLDPTKFEAVSDCHGFSFADGKLWINNSEVNKILEHDNYSSVSELYADIVVFSGVGLVIMGDAAAIKAYGVVHSAKAKKNGKYDHNAGLLPTKTDVTLEEAAGELTDASNPKNVAFYMRDSMDRPINTQLGTVQNGVRVITDPAQIKAFWALIAQ